MVKKCVECDRNVEELNDVGVEWQLDNDYCDECHSKLMKEWDEENESLNRYWRSTRL